MAALAAIVPRLRAACAELVGHAVPPSLVHGDLHLANVARGLRGYLHEDEAEAELWERLRAAYLLEWASFEPPGRLARAWELAAPLGTLHQAISYRSMAARLRPPVDPHLAQSTAWWLRRVLAGLAPSGA